MKKLVFLCSLCLCTANVFAASTAASSAQTQNQSVLWHNPNDITQGGIYYFKDSSGIGQGVPIFPGAEADVRKQLYDIQAKYPEGASSKTGTVTGLIPTKVAKRLLGE